VEEVVVAAAVLPLAFVGGFTSWVVSGTPFGVSAGVGLIILFGVSTINALILIGELRGEQTLSQSDRGRAPAHPPLGGGYADWGIGTSACGYFPPHGLRSPKTARHYHCRRLTHHPRAVSARPTGLLPPPDAL
jgi:hypothetical protein